MEGVTEFTECISETVDIPSPFALLEPPTSGGFLKLSKPCCYIFPGGRGDSALFAVNGFNILIDGGSDRSSCFWKLVRHLDRIDCLLLTHIGADNLPGINGLLQRKVAEQEEEQSQGSMTYSDRMKNLISPELGVVFFNVPEKLHTSECNLKVKRSIEEASLMLQYLSKLQIKPEPLFRVVSNTIEPITLFHKLGVGRLDMFVLNPVQDSKEMQFLMQKWAGNSKAKTGIVLANGKEGEISVPYLTSITALVVWLPASPTENIIRILFPGNAPQNKIFEGLEKLNHLDFLRYPVATQKNITSDLPPTAVKQTKIKQRTDSKEILKSSPKTHTATKASKKETNENEEVSIVKTKSDSVKENKVKEKKHNKPLRPKAEVTEKKKFLKEKSLKKHPKERVSKMDEKKDKEKRDIKKEKHEVKKDDGVKKDEKRVKAKDTLKPQLRKILKPDLKPFTPEVRKTLKAKTIKSKEHVGDIIGSITSTAQGAAAVENLSYIQDETMPGYPETEQTILDEEIQEAKDRIPHLQYRVGSYNISVPDQPGSFDNIHGVREILEAAMDNGKSKVLIGTHKPPISIYTSIFTAPLAEHIFTATSITEYDKLSSLPTSVADDQPVVLTETEEKGEQEKVRDDRDDVEEKHKRYRQDTVVTDTTTELEKTSEQTSDSTEIVASVCRIKQFKEEVDVLRSQVQGFIEKTDVSLKQDDKAESKTEPLQISEKIFLAANKHEKSKDESTEEVKSQTQHQISKSDLQFKNVHVEDCQAIEEKKAEDEKTSKKMPTQKMESHVLGEAPCETEITSKLKKDEIIAEQDKDVKVNIEFEEKLMKEDISTVVSGDLEAKANQEAERKSLAESSEQMFETSVLSCEEKVELKDGPREDIKQHSSLQETDTLPSTDLALKLNLDYKEKIMEEISQETSVTVDKKDSIKTTFETTFPVKFSDEGSEEDKGDAVCMGGAGSRPLSVEPWRSEKPKASSSGTPLTSDRSMRNKEIVSHLEEKQFPRDLSLPKPEKECVVDTPSPTSATADTSSKSVTEILSQPPLSDSKALSITLSSSDSQAAFVNDKHEPLLSSTLDFTCNENRTQSQITKSEGSKDKKKLDSDKSNEDLFCSGWYSLPEKNKLPARLLLEEANCSVATPSSSGKSMKVDVLSLESTRKTDSLTSRTLSLSGEAEEGLVRRQKIFAEEEDEYGDEEEDANDLDIKKGAREISEKESKAAFDITKSKPPDIKQKTTELEDTAGSGAVGITGKVGPLSIEETMAQTECLLVMGDQQDVCSKDEEQSRNQDISSIQSDTPHSNDDKHELEPQTTLDIKCEGSESPISAQAAMFDATFSSSSSSYSSSTSASYSTGQHYGERPDTPLTFPSIQLKSDGDSEFSSLKEEESPIMDLPYLSSGEHLKDEYMEVCDRNVPATGESVSCLARFPPLSPVEESKSFSQDQTSSAEEKSEEMSSITSDKEHLSDPKHGPTSAPHCSKPPDSAASNTTQPTEVTSDAFHMFNITPLEKAESADKPSEEKSSNDEPEDKSHSEEETSPCRIECYGSSADEKTSKVSLTEQHTDIKPSTTKSDLQPTDGQTETNILEKTLFSNNQDILEDSEKESYKNQ